MMIKLLLCLSLIALAVIGIQAKRPKTAVREEPASCLIHKNDDEYNAALEKFGCSCDHKVMCACCDYFDIPKVKVNNTGCIELVYLPEQIGFSLLFEIDNHVFMNKTISARNPPPLCYGVPHVETGQVCVDFYDLAVYHKVLSGCIQLQAYLADVKIFAKDVGCYKIPV